MRLINIIDKDMAMYLHSMGFKYMKANVDGKEVFQFIESDSLLKELHSKYEESSYFYSTYLTF